MPRKVRDLERDLQRAGFRRRPGKGSHRQWEHPAMPDLPVTISGNAGADAQRYQEKQVREALAELHKRDGGQW